MKGLKALERGFLALGLVLVAICGGGLFERSVSARLAIQKFDRASAARGDPPPAFEHGGEEPADFRLWAEKRVQTFVRSLEATESPPMAVLRIEKIDTRVPVFDGSDRLALRKGAAWIAGTARPGEDGNIGIAGHRDGCFRGLKDVSPGDTIELVTTRNTSSYRVDEIQIVEPDDVTVLRPRAAPTLTLVTCYPFYLVGNASRRYILHASLSGRADHNWSGRGSPQREPDFRAKQGEKQR